MMKNKAAAIFLIFVMLLAVSGILLGFSFEARKGPPPPPIPVTGYVTHSGFPVSGVTITVTQNGEPINPGYVTTDSDGYYEAWIGALVSGPATLTPQKAGWHFVPEFQVVNHGDDNINFSAGAGFMPPHGWGYDYNPNYPPPPPPPLIQILKPQQIFER